MCGITIRLVAKNSHSSRAVNDRDFCARIQWCMGNRDEDKSSGRWVSQPWSHDLPCRYLEAGIIFASASQHFWSPINPSGQLLSS